MVGRGLGGRAGDRRSCVGTRARPELDLLIALRGYVRAEATREAQERWTAHVAKMYEIMLMRKAKSWFTGYNSNVAGHEEGTVRYFVYNGGTPKFVGIINDVAARNYQEIEFSSGAGAIRQAASAGARA